MCKLLAAFYFLFLVQFLLQPQSIQAEEPAPEALPEVVVSSTRLPGDPVDPRTLPAKVTVITAEDIQKSGAKSVQEAVQYATGIVLYDQIGNAFQQTVDLRGFNGQPVPATSVFVDGVRVNEPDFNTINFDFIPLETIERIEIIPGASAIYGKNALGGAINIITKRGGVKPQVTADTLWGSFHRERYNLNASGPVGKFDYFSSYAYESETGFRDDSAGRISRYFGKVGYRPTEGTDLTASYTYVQDHLLQAGTLPLSQAAVDRRRNRNPGSFTDNESNLVNLNGRQTLPLGFSLSANVFYRHLGQEAFNVFGGGTFDSLNKRESRGGTAQLRHEMNPFGLKNVFVVGGEFTRNNFGSRSNFTPFPFPGLTSTSEDIWGAYTQDTFNLTPQVLLTTGVRYDQDEIRFEDDITPANSGIKRFSRTTPRAGLTYLVTPRTSVYFSYSQGFRVPTFDELFGPFGSNPFLKPVQSNNYEIGTKTQIGIWGEGSIALFHTDVRNEILTLCGDPTCAGTANQNIDKSSRQGIEATVKAKYNQYVDGVVNYTYTEALIESSFTLNNPFPFTENVRRGDSFPLVPKHRLGFTGNYHPKPEWNLSLTGLYVSTQFHLNDEQNAQPRLPGYFVLNGRVAYERPVTGGRLAAFFMVNNILDQKYFNFGIMGVNAGALERFVMPAPGIAFYGGLSYRFESF
jgi:iron complex outermembrane recepter protein